ncbi:gamma-butyrobetaine hydroxylase-like domain-containing protein [Acuticoccus mangrovi]|uniref:DUF971 domain-containing protein n=1 Tax=Acuticoccus mangrovi TaxID=2796142 RepID=A0A934ILT4_9HYPH|nr:gamma-butyrobetaine hydroxylase-like domain-containing protein [Acuticoccus mangrovi]MBJ3774607.1 DUF971 domain-containing protein [Acuticoccus mangrovi]
MSETPNAADDTAPWPLELRVSPARDSLTVRYEDGTSHAMPSEYLRVLTPSAERKGHGHPMVLGGKRGVTISSIHPVGRYAVRIAFSDGHASGLYTFENLFALGASQDDNWRDYEKDLATHGLSRDRPGSAPLRR